MTTKKSERIHANGKTRPVRDEKGHFIGSVSLKKTKERLDKAIDDYVPPTKKRPVKRGVSKSELVKRDEKPLMVNMLSLTSKEIVRPKPVTVSMFSLIKEGIEKQVTPTGRLTVYRVYNPSAGQGSGYYFVIKPHSQYETSEAVMTLYTPATDLIALERAIKKYRADNQ